MRDTRTNKYQVAWMKLLYGVTYNPFSRTLRNKAKLILLVVVPPALIDMILKNPNEEGLIRI